MRMETQSFTVPQMLTSSSDFVEGVSPRGKNAACQAVEGRHSKAKYPDNMNAEVTTPGAEKAQPEGAISEKPKTNTLRMNVLKVDTQKSKVRKVGTKTAKTKRTELVEANAIEVAHAWAESKKAEARIAEAKRVEEANKKAKVEARKRESTKPGVQKVGHSKDGVSRVGVRRRNVPKVGLLKGSGVKVIVGKMNMNNAEAETVHPEIMNSGSIALDLPDIEMVHFEKREAGSIGAHDLGAGTIRRAESQALDANPCNLKVKRRPGRPRKHDPPKKQKPVEDGAKRGPGRPRKSQAENADNIDMRSLKSKPPTWNTDTGRSALLRNGSLHGESLATGSNISSTDMSAPAPSSNTQMEQERVGSPTTLPTASHKQIEKIAGTDSNLNNDMNTFAPSPNTPMEQERGRSFTTSPTPSQLLVSQRLGRGVKPRCRALSLQSSLQNVVHILSDPEVPANTASCNTSARSGCVSP